MSHLCSRVVNLTVGADEVVWFTMDEEIGNRVDATAAISIPVLGEGAGDGTGYTSLGFAAGKYSNAASFVNLGPGNGWHHAQIGDNGVTLYPGLNHGANGFSFCFWRYVTSYNASGTPAGGIVRYGSGSHSIWTQFDSAAAPTVRFIDDLGGSSLNFQGWPTTTWEFWHLFYEPMGAPWTPGRFGYQINNGAKNYLAWSSTAAATASGYIYIYQAGYGVAIPNVWRIDEMCLKRSGILTAAQITYLYNAGAGRTWPVLLP